MSRRSNDKVHFFFKFNPTTNQSSCTVCNGKLSGNHVTNLRRHLTAKHSEVFDSFNEDTEETKNVKKRKIAYEATENGIISSIVKIVTTGGSSFLDSEGFREIINPIYDALQMTPITSGNIMEHVCEKELAIKEDITAAVKRKLVSLKLDVVTRQEKSILLINLHFMSSTLSKTEIVVKTLGMIQLFVLHTRIYIKNKILEIIQEYGIQIDQIFSITSDNGKNMAKDLELVNDDATEECLNDDEDDNGEHFMKLLDSMTFPNVPIHRCAAHTLQLCMSDVNKLSEISLKVNMCRQIVKVLRTGKFRRTLIENKKPIPALDVATRWRSTYKMIVKLFELKESITKEMTIGIEVDWPWVELYIEAFKETYKATLVLEQEHFSYSDFFILWMELKLKCEKSENYLTKELLALLKFRETKLLQNKTLLAAIYMDPRISLVLTEQQKMLAKGNLKNIALRIFNLNQDEGQQVVKQETNTDDLKEKSLLDSFLDNIQAAPQAPGGGIPEKLSKTYIEIENFISVYGRLPLSSDIKQFYHDLKFKSPQLSEVAQVVLASPATKVSVERSFSALNFVLNEKRSSLTAENINSLLVLSLNS